LNKSSRLWFGVGVFAWCVLPWYVLEDGLWSFEWLDGYPLDADYAPALALIAQGEKLWLAPGDFFLILPVFAGLFRSSSARQSASNDVASPLAVSTSKNSDTKLANMLLIAGVGGLCWLAIQGFGIGIRGWNYESLNQLFGPLEDRQFGMGFGGLFVTAAFLFYLTTGIAGRGAVNGDVFVVGAIGLYLYRTDVVVYADRVSGAYRCG